MRDTKPGGGLLKSIQIISNSRADAAPLASLKMELSESPDFHLEVRPTRSLGYEGIVVVLGDRPETATEALLARHDRCTLVHIHGGDKAPGDYDDLYRDAISRLADVHLVATEEARDRLLQMGEPKSRIHVVGYPGWDDILRYWKSFDTSDFQDAYHTGNWVAHRLGFPVDSRYVVIIQHPTGRSDDIECATMLKILEAVKCLGLKTVVIHPNQDKGSYGIRKAIREFQPDFVIPSFQRTEFIIIASQAVVLVGNSSCGIIESGPLKIPAVNVGDRQRGRVHSHRYIFDAEESKEEIILQLQKASKAKCFTRLYIPPHDSLSVSQKMVAVIQSIQHPMPKKLLTY